MATAAIDIKTVLVVEDDDTTRQAFGCVLRRAGYAAPLAANGLEAADYLHHHPPPDAIVLDMFMPGFDGWTLLHEWGAESALARIPVLIVTALGDASLSWAASLGARAYLRKPVAEETLVGAVQRCVTL